MTQGAQLLRRWWERPLSVDGKRARRWWVGSVSAGVFTVSAWVTQVELGQDLPVWAHLSLLTFGATSALLGFLLPVRQAAAARTREAEATKLATNAVSDYRTKLNNVMTPIARMAGEILATTDDAVRDRLRDRFTLLVVSLARENIGRGDTRVCFFEYDNESPWRFVCDGLQRGIYLGRTDAPRSEIKQESAQGQAIQTLIDTREARFVSDTEKETVEDFDQSTSAYRTFICAPVMAGGAVIGLLAVDSLVAGDLRKQDVKEVQLFALALACGLAERDGTFAIGEGEPA